MTSDDSHLGINENWNIESTGLNAAGDLPDLLPAMSPWIARREF
jgi:hypothetical protein